MVMIGYFGQMILYCNVEVRVIMWCCDDMILCDIVMVWWLDILIEWCCYIAMLRWELYCDVAVLWYLGAVMVWWFDILIEWCCFIAILRCDVAMIWYYAILKWCD